MFLLNKWIKKTPNISVPNVIMPIMSIYSLSHIDNKFQLIPTNHEYKRNDSSAVHPGL